MSKGRYELIELAGQGGMAEVWRGRMSGEAGFSRDVAIKKMKPEFRAMKNYIDMFFEEARVGSELNHPNIVQVFDFCKDAEGNYYLVMEWVEGIDLHSLIYSYRSAGERIPWELAVVIGAGALSGLSAAHERTHADSSPAPVIHRDISPANILLSTQGTVKLTDFGLARAKDRIAKLTAPGMVKGKLSYLAPELAHGKDASPASDIHAMGNTLWEVLAQQRLFFGATEVDVFQQIRSGVSRPILDVRGDVPEALAQVIDRALAANPLDRYQTAREMAKALRRALEVTGSSIDGEAFLGDSVRWVAARRKAQAEKGRSSASSSVEPTWSMAIDLAPSGNKQP